jgi:hypothetical protein
LGFLPTLAVRGRFRLRRQEEVPGKPTALDCRVQEAMVSARAAIRGFVRLLQVEGIAGWLVVRCEQQFAVRRPWALKLWNEGAEWRTAMETMGYVPFAGMSAGWRTFEGWSKRGNGLESNPRLPRGHVIKDNRMMPASLRRNVGPDWLGSAARYTR